nr:MAM and LDL-receptor class A domain-containing protein 1-like [Lytechinus pictus]
MANFCVVCALLVSSLIFSLPEHVLGGFSCNFELDMCSYSQDQGDDFDWTRFQGSTETSDTGPDVDHTHGTTQGYYMYVEASERSDGSKARLTSTAEDAAQPRCAQFFYSMYGDTMGSLSVYVKESSSSSLGDPVWSLAGERGNGWFRGLASIQDNANQVQLVFEAVIGSGKYSDIAIDDITVEDGPCPVSDVVNCTFESIDEDDDGMCGFVLDETSQFDFIRTNGKTASSFRAPSVDHTTKTELGFFMNVEGYYSNKYKFARLKSPLFRGIQGDDSETFCVVFWYHMFKDDIGELNVYLRNKSSTSMGSPIWSLAGSRGDVWRGAEVEINTPEDFNIIFEGNRGGSYSGDIALDDILITSYGCPGHHILLNESSVSCGFEEIELCYYVQDNTDTIEWEWQNQATEEDNTGPATDHTRGDELGFYLFVSSGLLVDSDDVARIMSPIATASTSKSSCVEFWYHMWGRAVETLNVYIKRESMALPSTPVTKVTGDQGNYWHRRTFTVPAGSGNYRVVFEGIPGEEVRDDIAIDDVMLYQDKDCPEFITEAPTPTTMPPPRDNIDCDFEEDFCDYTQEIDADYGDWIRRKGKDTRSSFSNTGPKLDHTLGTGEGYVAGFDPYDLKGVKLGDQAAMKSPVISPKTYSRCLVFYAYLYGYGVDYFTLQIVEWGGRFSMDPPFAIYGAQGEKWLELQMDVPSSILPFQIVFVATVGTSKYASEIAMDDVTLRNGKCQSQGSTEAPTDWAANCDFESPTDPLCGYTNYNYNKFDWIVHSGSTSTGNTGPSNDHTTGTAAGHYVYVESSIPHRPTYRTTLVSPIINSRNQDLCARFYYYAHGKDVGSLSVDVDIEDFYSDITPFSISGEQGDRWLPANVDIPASFTGIYDFRLEFSTKKISSGFEGDIAIDDIMFLRQPCDGYPSESTCNFEQGMIGCDYSTDNAAQYRWQWYDLLAIEEPPLNTITTSYLYAKASSASAGQTAVLSSAIYDLNGRTHCLTVDTVLTADSAQQLLIQAQDTNTKRRIDIGSLSGDISGSWIAGNWTIPGDLTSSSFQFIFTAVYGSTTRGVIAIDNVVFSKHLDACEKYAPLPTKEPIRTSARPSSKSASSASSVPTMTTKSVASRQPIKDNGPNVGMIVGIIIALIIVAAAVIGVVLYFKYRSSMGLGSLTIGYKNEKMDAMPFSGVTPGNGGGGNMDPQVVIGGANLGSDA